MTPAVSTCTQAIPPMSDDAVRAVRGLEAEMMKLPQIEVFTEHLIHGGIYARTVCLRAGVLIAGALIKRATVLIVQGDCTVFTGDAAVDLRGYHVLPASAGRKQVFRAHTDTMLTMLFPTEARTAEEAEAEFTDEADLLVSRREPESNHVIITGE